MKPLFTEPKIIHFNYDMNREWYIYFRYYHQGKWRKKTYKSGINRFKKKEDRMREACNLRDALAFKLKSEGWNPFGESNHQDRTKTICQAIDEILETKRSSMKVKSIRTYNDVANMFKNWIEANEYKYLLPHNFTNTMARSYLDYLLVEKKYAGKTHNGQLGILKTIFNGMLDREIIDKNPFKGIKELPEEMGKNVAYTDEERKKIRDYLYEHNKRLYYAVQFVYYCFIRRSELIQLKVGDIDFNNMTIRIGSSVSKNRKQECVTIPKSFEPILYEVGLDKAPKGALYLWS
ncbi:MAG: site-specific integrase [Candidatus Methanofastidiosa archaeon]|nr:site-specific integrase [Candidatus Methanofastidiosa archaeon]